MSQRRPLSEKVSEFMERETRALLSQCTPEQQAFAEKIIAAHVAVKREPNWATLHSLAIRTLEKNAKVTP